MIDVTAIIKVYEATCYILTIISALVIFFFAYRLYIASIDNNKRRF